jgi:hypothetical protein
MSNQSIMMLTTPFRILSLTGIKPMYRKEYDNKRYNVVKFTLVR